MGFLARATDLANGACPTLPVLCLTAAPALWGFTELVRLQSTRVALAEEAIHPLVQTINGDLQEFKNRWRLLNRSILVVPIEFVWIPGLVIAAICAFCFDPFFAPLVTTSPPPTRGCHGNCFHLDCFHACLD
jgi:hypothetical protein